MNHRVVIRGMTYVVGTISSDTAMTINPEYRGVNNATSVKMAAVIDYRVRELLDDPTLPAEPQTHLTAQGFSKEGPILTGPAAQGTRPRRYFSSTTTGLE